jgi:hypothetical protein
MAIIPSLIVCFRFGFEWFDFLLPLLTAGMGNLLSEWRKK